MPRGRYLMLAFVFTITLFGCAINSVWVKPNISDAEAQRDSQQCGNPGRVACLQAKGYRLVPQADLANYKKCVSEAYDLYEKGEYRNAIREYQKASTFLPDEAVPYSMIGWSFLALGEYEDAFRNFNTSRSLKEDCLSYMGILDTYTAQGKNELAELNYNKALMFCENAIAINPDTKRYFEMWKASNYIRKGDVENARQILKSGWIGVHLAGNKITSVAINSPAYFCGLKRGDVIMDFAGVDVSKKKVQDIVKLIEESYGKEVPIGIQREDNYISMKIVPGVTDQLAEQVKLASKGTYTTGKQLVMGKSWLGITIKALDREEKEKLKLKGADGVLVSEVDKDGPGDKGGLKPGDLIVEVENRRISKVEDLLQIVSNEQPGKRLKIEFVREGEGRVTRVTLEEKPK